MNKRVLIAIPAYRCEKQIRRVLSGLVRLRSSLPSVERVIVLDNQSPDGTAAAASDQVSRENASDWIEVQVNPVNRGLGGSQKRAFRLASERGFSHVIVLHGDDQADPTDIPDLLDALGEGRDAVLGSRFMKGSRREGYSLLRTFGNRGLNGVYSLLSGSRVSDLGSGLNGFRVEALRDLPFETFADQFTFNMDLLLSLIEHGKKILFIPIRWREQDQASNARTFAVGW
ncbi:MAG TPA: glycosyltransferase family 2 protein, partial [Pseudobdellovibrionaceae bacterium]|nr:glycosyltransferase family 2 protein [Pseudobdellovibrionaceae bacterium]